MRSIRSLVLTLVLVAAALAGCVSDPATQPDEAPAWHFTDTEGTEHDEGTVQGSPTVLFFMATWCSSCKRMTGELTQVHQAHPNGSVDMLSISFDPTETEQDLEAWKDGYDQPWPHGTDPGQNVQSTFGITSQSSVVVLDDEGYVVRSWGYGQADAAGIEAALDDATSPN